MKRERHLWCTLALSFISAFVHGHGGFQCLAELESRALVFAHCDRTSLACDKVRESLMEQLSDCRSAGFDERVVDRAVQLGSGRKAALGSVSALHLNRSKVLVNAQNNDILK